MICRCAMTCGMMPREITTCSTHPDCPSLMTHCAGIVEVNRNNFHVRVKSVFVEEYSKSSKISQVIMTRLMKVLEVLDCFLKGDDKPFPRDVPSQWHLLSLVDVPNFSSKCFASSARVTHQVHHCENDIPD